MVRSVRIPYVIIVLFADFEKCHIIVNIGRFNWSLSFHYQYVQDSFKIGYKVFHEKQIAFK